MIGFTEDSSLRQKTINLVYILLLALIFSFIPSEFMDSVQTSEESLTMLCETVEEQNSKYALMVLDYIKEDQVLFDDLKYSILAIDQKTNAAIAQLENLKMNLIRERGFNEFGYLRDGKRERASNKLMIHEHQADSLFQMLETYKRNMAELLPPGELAVLDSMLPLKDFHTSSDGRLVKSDEFYFFRTPLNAAVLNISQFRARIERIRHYTTRSLIRVNIENKDNSLPILVLDLLEEQGNSPVSSNVESENSSTRTSTNQTRSDYISDFFSLLDERQRSLPKKANENLQYLFVESKTDSIYAIGKPIRFSVQFDTSETQSVNVSVSNFESETTKRYTMNKPGTFLYVPPRKGIYSFTFKSPFGVRTKSVKVIDAEPVLQNNDMGVLYVGMDNALNIETSIFEDTEGLVARISNGQILKKGKNFYARVDKKEIVRVDVFAKMPYGFVQVAQKKFAVRDLIPPYGSIGEFQSGHSISLSELGDLRSIDVNSAEYLVNEKFYVSSFEFTIIYNLHTAILQPIKHQGSSLNATAIDALKRVKPGDILLFDNIQTKSSLGNALRIAPITLTVTQ